MIEMGVITGSGYRINPKSLGFRTCTYVGVRLEKASMYKDVLPHLYNIPEIVECHYTTGPYSLLIKLFAIDNDHLMDILNSTIQEIPGIVSTETLISLAEGFNRGIKIPEGEQ